MPGSPQPASNNHNNTTTTPSTQQEPSDQQIPTHPPSPKPAEPAIDTQGAAETGEFDFQEPSTSTQQAQDVEADKATGDKAGIAELIAQYGSSSATSWLEFARYKIWRPTVPIPGSSFPPVQGYLRSDPFVFAWGNPIVSDPAALEATCAAFIDWAKSQKLRPIWLCVDGQMEQVLGAEGSKFRWSTLSCIVEDFLDPRSVVELAHSRGGGSEVKDFKKNLRRAERENVRVREVQPDQWTDAMKRQVEEGIVDWKKSKTGIQIASTSFQPWLDFEHRRYWIAEKDSNIVAILVLAHIHHKQYQIKNAASFPNAPRGTSEEIIYRAMLDLQDEGSTPSGIRHGGVAVTFGITASDSLTPVDNLSGWKITWLSKTYNKVIGLTGLTRRGDFRNKFHSQHIPMYVCYPAEDGFGLDGVNKLIKSLRQ
ncbi:hypothetical protein B0F90DRAFT_1628641 [Multifurca ochricompacta]|uniref:Phosphatidylglycerol lysyltransferase C-terminal domain-containing protein n=1 Tax=Multifurca ochricompacta TaxID=376703 RepID=A0AAD4QNX9_9AGAM|nr:hypothetical protein B0F90DRAFT_1628641 [Multifurca ochricompacta]